MKNLKNQKGFTLIEILVVIGIIALLATIVLIAINPAKQFAAGRVTQRTSNLNSILNAIGQQIVDNKGNFTACVAGIPTLGSAPTLPLTATPAGSLKIASGGAAGTVDLACLVTTYIASFPVEPSGSFAWHSPTDYDTGYYVFQFGGRVTVFSPNLEPLVNQNPGKTEFVAVTR